MVASFVPTFVLGLATFASAVPLARRRVDALNEEATAEAHQRDATATRAFSSVDIKASNGKCFFVDPLSGDFRSNLTPVELRDCDNSAGQKWDVITAGKHNDQPGTALVVSALTQACLNFDPRRAAGNQVILFSCGGRADGEGLVTNSQLFKFDGAAALTLEPTNSAGTCLTIAGNVVDQAGCNGSQDQVFTIGAGGAAAPPAQTPPTPPAEAPVTPPVEAPVTPPAEAPVTPPAEVPVTPPASAVDGAPVARGGTLNAEAAAEANQRDNTATRAFSSVPIKAANGNCLSVDPLGGDFRQNLIPIAIQPCDGSAGQNFDIITAGEHNNQAGAALVVSSLVQGCVNFDPRRAAGDQVILFSCGGRADGDGLVTDSQLFKFAGAAAITLEPKNAAGTCLVPDGGELDQAACNNGQDQLFTIGGGQQAPAVPPPAAEAPAPPTAPVTPPPVTPPPVAEGTVARGGTLDAAATAEAHVRDDTATRAFSSVPIKTADGQCLSINPLGGDFRQNLIPVDVKSCDNSLSQQFDIITAGKHNDQAGTMLVVSALTQGCLNFDPRRATGDQVILFACGGRADGDGRVTDSQLFPVQNGGTIELAPVNAKGATCLAPVAGKVDAQACNQAAAQKFTIG